MTEKWKDHPFFRKNLIPWYDSTKVCWFLVVVMLGIFFFALAGIAPALEMAPDCLWVPLILSVMSFFLTIKILLRIKRRRDESSR